MKKALTLILLITTLSVFGQKQAYRIYGPKGKEVSYEKMLKHLEKQDIILFGEQHNNPISHWLQYEVTADLNEKHELILGAEMFEADDQLHLNQYLADSITFKEFDSLARLWNNYKTDYAPLVDFAKDNGLDFIASNVPRRYANLVYKQGFGALDSLSEKEKNWIAPLPIAFDGELPTYKNILSMMGDHGTPELVEAQAVKDATMAHFILENYIKGNMLIHYNGAYHSDRYEGILWYLKQKRNDLRYATITTVSQENINKLLEENHDVADFIICVDSHMTTTY